MNLNLIKCPNCQTAFRVKSENAGRKARCAQCSSIFIVPNPDSEGESPTQNDSLLMACPYCGFQDIGNFCSHCGGRISEPSPLDFESCKIPPSVIQQLLDEQDFSLAVGYSDPDDARWQIGAACKEFNQEIDSLKRSWRFERGERRLFEFGRSNCARLIDSLPACIPGRQTISDRLWTLIGNVEREITAEQVHETCEVIKREIERGDEKRATKAIEKVRKMQAERPCMEVEKQIRNAEAAYASMLESHKTTSLKQEFDKLLTKAEKLAFQQEFKKAIKGFQDCLFWLSRNEIPDRHVLETEINGHIDRVRKELE